MNINLMPWAVLWGVLAAVVLALIVVRSRLAAHEDDSIHLEGGTPSDQVALDHRLAAVDKWGKAVTVVTVAFGLVLAAIYVYQIWTNVPSY